jgi:hypothetical protein
LARFVSLGRHFLLSRFFQLPYFEGFGFFFCRHEVELVVVRHSHSVRCVWYVPEAVVLLSSLAVATAV